MFLAATACRDLGQHWRWQKVVASEATAASGEWTGSASGFSFETTSTVSINNTKTKALTAKMSSSGHKRIIRREEGDTPRTQSEYFPSDDIGDAFFSDEAPGAVTHPHPVAPQQHVDENAEIMQQFRLDGCRPTHHIQGAWLDAQQLFN
jgi:hypothetical protein